MSAFYLREILLTIEKQQRNFNGISFHTTVHRLDSPQGSVIESKNS